MKRSLCCFGGFLLVFAVMFSAALGETASDEKFISWNDLLMNQTQDLKRSEDGFINGTRIIVVNKNGTGDSLTVQGAVDMVPLHNTHRVKIFIHPGIYREKVFIPSTKPYISFIGKERRGPHTVITWHDKASDKDNNGEELGTYRTASVAVESDYFCASEITFQNTVTAVPGDEGKQAVALRIAGDKAVFYRVRFIGSQDTLLDETGSHYFYESHIQGSVDFIFGSARSLYESCVITSTAENYGAIAAHHRDTAEEDTGFSFFRCVINGSGKVLLGRAWGNYSRTIYSNCYMEDMIFPTGWSDWDIPSRQRTAVFGEHNCRGAGAETRNWVPWAKSFTVKEVRPFTNMTFIHGDQWLNLS